ncbi:MAG: hypothetical protein JXA82_12675 [Sedimentisphaerales bacterium]|nr:hypothetical protein [Sedimentisphaerales bacterium]
MFTIDLLKGSGVPLHSNPLRTAMRSIPFMIPLFLIVALTSQYLHNNTLLAVGRSNLENMQMQILRCRDDMTAYEQYMQQITQTRNRLREVAGAIDRHIQWSDVIRALSENLPDRIAIQQLDLKRSASRKKVSDKDNPEKLLTQTIINRTLLIWVYGPQSTQTDRAVQEFLQKLQSSSVLLPMIEDIRISSRYEEEIDETVVAVYEIECLFKTQEP